MSVQIAKGLQVFDCEEKEIYIEVAEGQYVGAKFGLSTLAGNLRNTCGNLLISKEEQTKYHASRFAQHPRGGFLYGIDEIDTPSRKVRKIMVRWDNETGRLC